MGGAWAMQSQCCRRGVATSKKFSLPSLHQVLIVSPLPILFLTMASNAAAFVGDAVASLKTVMDLAETVPVLGNIVEALQYVKGVADTATHNKKNCAKVSKRCEALALTLESCVLEYSKHGGPPTPMKSMGTGTMHFTGLHGKAAVSLSFTEFSA